MVRRSLSLVLGGVLMLAALAAVVYRASYGSWGTPEHVTYCGRTYRAAGSSLTLTQVRQRERRTALAGDLPYPVTRIGEVPPVFGRRMVAARVPEAERARRGVPCAMSVYVRTGSDRYAAYRIQGGP